ncbi:hypothetical protein [Herbidospora yilanensis]|uniref:hypothetical protein n=1 Tax=Herbidospora yilanensis TaxID=354426 RepID=UPI0007C73D3D|nr:hypothetical protein [Herbidospora yilanensis]
MRAATRDRWFPLTVLVVALSLLLGSIVWVANGITAGPGWGGAAPGAGPIRDAGGAWRAAQRVANGWGLRVHEVMQFTNGYYAQLVDGSGRGATEVLINPDDGTVQVEWGPAMMWNTRFGMHPARQQVAVIGSQEARGIADRWLNENEPGLRAGEAEAFPGYFTLHTMRKGEIVGMLSVQASSGAVWYHTWHGRFVRMLEEGASDPHGHDPGGRNAASTVAAM